MSEPKAIVIASAARTAVGTFNGAFANVPAHELGATVIKGALERAGVAATDVDEVILGQVLTAGEGQNPARQAAMEAGCPKETTAFSINQLCGSGLRAVALGMQQILSGDAKIIVAGAPYIQDVVLTGLNMKEVGALLFPSPACREVAGLGADAPWADVVAHPAVRQRIEAVLDGLAREATDHHNSSMAETRRLVEEAESRASAAEERARQAAAQIAAQRTQAETESEGLLSRAKREADQLISSARAQAETISAAGHAEAERGLAAIRAEVERLTKRRDAITAQLAPLSNLIAGFAHDADDATKSDDTKDTTKSEDAKDAE